METKKNPDKDLRNKSLLFFQIGLALMLLISWRAIEWKTYDKEDIDLGVVNLDMLEEEDVPITEMQNKPPPPPPPPPPAPEVIEVIEDDSEIEEEVIESTETTEMEVVEVEDVQEVEEEIGDVPFAIIQQVPIFPGCENAKDKKKCMNEKISKYVDKNFDRSLGSELGLTGRNRVSVQFKIDKNGDVVDVKARGPHPRLEQEAIRVIKGLPKMIPGEQRGQKVGVLYGLPINFFVQE
ncbi:energy transducer TonB [Flavobacterium sp. CS20]|uniref:energy transducer TonB n=1 Tax=Flavobacterium sp. CS20 TaxID=2775246 RepID=UPI001B39E28E|nr:energy transducer TonB [Flavobacterium sp. CS20]QTY26950.1 energy transducer TonB [Flavobacterium sp. CS20]